MIKLNLPVHSIAHARAGDKGDVSNISLIAYLESGWPVIEKLATEEKVLEIFKHMGATKVDRYKLPNLKALNLHRGYRNFFVCKNAHRGRLQKIQRYYILEEVNDMNEARF